MIKLLKISVLSAFLFCFGLQLNAQKFGHLNSGNLIAQMPEAAMADSILKIYQDSLVIDGQAKADAFRKEVAEYQSKLQDMTPIAAKKREDELRKTQEGLMQFEEQLASLVSIKREALLVPILDKLQENINAVGKEKGYTMIFDTSIFNAVLFSQDSDDIEPLVKAKMGFE